MVIFYVMWLEFKNSKNRFLVTSHFRTLNEGRNSGARWVDWWSTSPSSRQDQFIFCLNSIRKCWGRGDIFVKYFCYVIVKKLRGQ